VTAWTRGLKSIMMLMRNILKLSWIFITAWSVLYAAAHAEYWWVAYCQPPASPLIAVNCNSSQLHAVDCYSDC
jgi:hypothetical protein